jgi:hypothetical protein
MNDDDVLGSALSPAPKTSPLVRGAQLAALVLVMGSVVGCNPGDPIPERDAIAPGVDGSLIYDAGTSPPPDAAAPPDATPGVDAGADVGSPGVPDVDSGPPEK